MFSHNQESKYSNNCIFFDYYSKVHVPDHQNCSYENTSGPTSKQNSNAKNKLHSSLLLSNVTDEYSYDIKNTERERYQKDIPDLLIY